MTHANTFYSFFLKDLLYIFGRYVNHDVEEEKDRFGFVLCISVPPFE